MTPVPVHYGQAQALFKQRADTLNAAFEANQKRFKRNCPQPQKLPVAAWINRPEKELDLGKKSNRLHTKLVHPGVLKSLTNSEAGAWTRPTSRCRASGSTSIAQSTVLATQWTSCSPPSGTGCGPSHFGARHQPTRCACEDHRRQEWRQHRCHRKWQG